MAPLEGVGVNPHKANLQTKKAPKGFSVSVPLRGLVSFTSKRHHEHVNLFYRYVSVPLWGLVSFTREEAMTLEEFIQEGFRPLTGISFFYF